MVFISNNKHHHLAVYSELCFWLNLPHLIVITQNYAHGFLYFLIYGLAFLFNFAINWVTYGIKDGIPDNAPLARILQMYSLQIIIKLLFRLE